MTSARVQCNKNEDNTNEKRKVIYN